MRRLLPLVGLASLLGLAGSPAFSAPPPAPGETGDILQARDPGETGKGALPTSIAGEPGEAGDPGLRLAQIGEAGGFEFTLALDPGEAGGTIRAFQAKEPGESGTMLSAKDPGEAGPWSFRLAGQIGEAGGDQRLAQADPGEGGPQRS